jgi:stage III sporulation protein SpoIIIAA
MSKPQARLQTADPFPTTRLSVPNLARLVWRLRDDSIPHSVTIVHSAHEGEGELALSIAAARIARRGVKVAGPEPSTAFDLIEYGMRVGAKVVFCGELRRADDGRALRAAAHMGVRVVGIVTNQFFAEAQTIVKALGPWESCSLEFFSISFT